MCDLEPTRDIKTESRETFDAEFKRIGGEHAQTVWGFEAQIQQVEQEKEQELVRLTEERRALEAQLAQRGSDLTLAKAQIKQLLSDLGSALASRP